MAKYDKAEVMRRAWADFRKRNAGYAAKGFSRRDPFSICLAHQWAQIKRETAETERRRIREERDAENARQQREWRAKQFPDTPLGKVKWDIFLLEMKDRWTDQDFAQIDRLKAEKARIEKEEAAA